MKNQFCLAILVISGIAHGQAVYGPNGEYKGYIQTSPNGVSNSYSATGAFQGSAQVQGNQTNFYGPQGQYQGNIQAPIYTPPNTTIGTPPQVNQVPSIKSWWLDNGGMTTYSSSNCSQKFSVDVFSERRPLNESPWLHIGKFDDLNQAINACKKIVDDFLRSRANSAESADQLAINFLHHGDVPTINGAENLNCFDIYDYLTQRCGEIFSARKCSSIHP